MVPFEVRDRGPEAVAHYSKMIADGQTERWATMCALQCPPGTAGSDRAFMQRRCNGEYLGEMHAPMASRLVQEARAVGINPSGKFYMGGLADKRGHMDPMAWVSSVDDVRRVAQARDLEVHGIIDYVPPEKEPPKRVDIDPGILRDNVEDEMRKDPSAKREDVVEKVKEKIVPHWKRKKGYR